MSVVHEHEVAMQSHTKSAIGPLLQLEVSSANGTISFEITEMQRNGGMTRTEGSGQSTSTGKAVYNGEKIPNLRGPGDVPKYFILAIQNATARLILTKDARSRAEVVFDRIYRGDQVPQLDGVYGGDWVQNIALP